MADSHSHHLFPHLREITNCSFYWGKIDINEARKLLEGKSEGTFLLRDSSHEDYLFAISSKLNGHDMNMRIDQCRNRVSLYVPYQTNYKSLSATEIIGHHKNTPSERVLNFKLKTPLRRNFPFDLKHLARVALLDYLTYNCVENLCLPQSLKKYLREYSYEYQPMNDEEGNNNFIIPNLLQGL